MVRSWALWLLALVLGLAALFGPALAGGTLLAPGEAIALYFPFRAIGFEGLRAGEWPFWNPFNFGGSPLLAAMQGGFFFPANWAFLVLPPVAAMNVAVVGTYAIAGTGTWALARACGLGRLGSAIAAMAFTASGFLLAHMEHLAIVQAAAMLPVMLWAIARRCATGRARYDLAFALALALQLVAGHPQTLVLSLLVAVPFALWCAWDRTWPERLRTWLILGAMAALGLGLGALQLLPTLDLISESQRQAFPYELLVAESLPPRQLLSLWFPFLFGAPPSAMFPTPYWGAGPWFNERVGYVGVTTLGLAVIGLLGARRTPGVRFWAVVAAIGLVLALGGTTPIYKLWAQLPILKALRAPARHLLEVDLALAMLAGYGAQQLAGRLVARRQALVAWAVTGLPVIAVVAGVGVAGAAIASRMQPFMPAEVNLSAAFRLQQPAIWLPLVLWALLGLGLAVRPRGRAWQAALALLVAADLWVFAQHQGWRQLSAVAPPTLGENLLASMSPERHLSLYRSPYPYYDPALVQRVVPAGYAALFGQRSVSGYDAFIKAPYAAIMGQMTHGGAMSDPTIWSHTHHALDIYGVRRLHVEAAMLDEPIWRERLAAPRWRRIAEAPGQGTLAGSEPPGPLRGPLGAGVTLENTQALPRAWRVEQATLTPSSWVLQRMTRDGAFDPRREALVEAPLSTSGLTAGPASATSAGFNGLRVKTDGPGPGFVVVSETHDAGWKAFLGDRALSVHRVDGTLMGVEVPAGPQTVDLVYEPPRWRTGLAVSGLSALLLAAWGLTARWRRRRAG